MKKLSFALFKILSLSAIITSCNRSDLAENMKSEGTTNPRDSSLVSKLKSTAISNRKIMTGDFNGDGYSDFAVFRNENGAWTVNVYLSAGSGTYSSAQRWATMQGGYGDAQKWVAGDFNGDGKTDLAKYWNDNNGWTVDVHISTGSGFVMQRWATQQGAYWDALKWFVADFNGDGKADMAKFWNDGNGWTVDVHISSGSGFVMQRWATKQGGYWDAQRWLVGDFNGDGKADFANIWDEGHYANIDVHLSTGSSFGCARWATKQGWLADDQKWYAGDFNGDGITDLSKFWTDAGAWNNDVHVSTGSSFVMQRWATQQGGYWDSQIWFTGDFNGDHRTDFAKFWNDAGAWTADTHISTGGSFSMNRWTTRTGTCFSNPEWHVCDQNSDQRTDLLTFGEKNLYSWVSTGSSFNLYQNDPRCIDFTISDFKVYETNGPEVQKVYYNGNLVYVLSLNKSYDLKVLINNLGDKGSEVVRMKWTENGSIMGNGCYQTGGIMPESPYWTAISYVHMNPGDRKIKPYINRYCDYNYNFEYPEYNYDNNTWIDERIITN